MGADRSGGGGEGNKVVGVEITFGKEEASAAKGCCLSCFAFLAETDAAGEKLLFQAS